MPAIFFLGKLDGSAVVLVSVLGMFDAVTEAVLESDRVAIALVVILEDVVVVVVTVSQKGRSIIIECQHCLLTSASARSLTRQCQERVPPGCCC